MPFRIFLKAHIANSLFFLLALFVFDLILWLDPLHQIQLNTVLYVSLIVILMGMVALVWRYQKQTRGSKKWPRAGMTLSRHLIGRSCRQTTLSRLSSPMRLTACSKPITTSWSVCSMSSKIKSVH